MVGDWSLRTTLKWICEIKLWLLKWGSVEKCTVVLVWFSIIFIVVKILTLATMNILRNQMRTA